MPAPFLIVGLGNPGAKYETTRHNVGFMVLDELASRYQGSFSTHKKSNSDIIEARLGDAKIVLAKPRTYMNLSGGPIRALCDFFKIPAAQVIVVHDELDLDFGVVRLKQGGGENGHNGLRSTSSTLGTKDYLRVRVGIGRPPGRQDPADYVLRNFSASEQADLGAICATAADGAELIVERGLQFAQNAVHSH
ncbi:aminoacyl-tRNA hydrolase [Corynebacterium epidermidicanis]|uniref:Peptidyl-tRNA hydrolase n=2 Tax=Corynebacterium epidermidicanis TaxID=1050174 RepID=A0A0G3GV61_9CORY|nr:aminoacyl-tRNA hydrolase [Corynebacterium epidermidicanis]AKK02717.1 aminoacyl-tRNA hydrolase [Corynebacterium epidermidicanis]